MTAMVMPQRLGRYAVTRRIGSGGFATVWLAYDDQLASPVAIKVLADNWTSDAHVRRRFVEEGRYLRRVDSPHVVTVYDAGELDDERPYLVMTYADRGTLADRISEGGLTPAETARIVSQVASGLQALHDHDVLHRDVKPANVLFKAVNGSRAVSDGGTRALLGDLGLGKALDVSSRLTMVAGTPAYVAPEQARAESLDARADQYALAALAYLLLAGRSAFDHTSLQAAAEPGELPPLSAEGHEFPEAVEAAVRRGMAPDREDRFPTVSEFADALSAALSGTADTVTSAPVPIAGARVVRPNPDHSTQRERPSTTVRRRKGRWWRRTAAAAVLAVLGAGAAVTSFEVAHGAARVRVTDDTGQLSVSVPKGWADYRATNGWNPPSPAGSPSTTEPALSTGTNRYWNNAQMSAQGVFVALVPGSTLAARLPRHPACTAGKRKDGVNAVGQHTATVLYTGCPDGLVIEQRIQLAGGKQAWVQVHSDSVARAYDVLDSVRAHAH